MGTDFIKLNKRIDQYRHLAATTQSAVLRSIYWREMVKCQTQAKAHEEAK